MSRGSSLLMTAVLAAGIGGTATMFSLVDSAVLHPLRFTAPDRIMVIAGAPTPPQEDRLRWWQKNDAFSSLATFSEDDLNLNAGNISERVSVAKISASFFTVLGVTVQRGRPFNNADEDEGRRVAILSDGLWRQNFGADPDAVGEAIVLNGVSYQVVGIMPAAFSFPVRAKLWIPRGIGDKDPTLGQSSFGLEIMIGRLAPAVTREQAQQRLSALLASLEESFGKANLNVGHSQLSVIPLGEKLVANVQTAVTVLFVACCCILLIICTNVSHLLLIRTAARRKEMAIRLALGAKRSHLVAQCALESSLIAALGGAVGLLATQALIPVFTAISSIDLTLPRRMQLDLNVAAAGTLFTIFTAVFISAVPSIQTALVDFSPMLKQEGYQSRGGVGNTARRLMVMSQVGLALMLLLAAGLLLQSLSRLLKVDVGFDPAHAFTAGVELPQAKYSKASHIERFQQDTLEKLRSVPGVQAAGFVSLLPIEGNTESLWISTAENSKTGSITSVFTIAGDYFKALGIPLIVGRFFNEGDRENTQKVAVISVRAARLLFGNKIRIGEQIRVGGEEFTREIVGIVADIKASSLTETDSAQLYLPFGQPFHSPPSKMNVVIRTQNSPGWIPTLRAQLSAIDKDTPFFDFQTLQSVISGSVRPTEFRSMILTIFAAFAVVLAVIGVYGVVAYSTALRTHEIGVRSVLGATRSGIMFLILRDALQITLVGAVAGLIASIWLNRFFSNLLFEVGTSNIATYAGTTIVLILACLIASFIPAYKAARAEPADALRYE